MPDLWPDGRETKLQLDTHLLMSIYFGTPIKQMLMVLKNLLIWK